MLNSSKNSILLVSFLKNYKKLSFFSKLRKESLTCASTSLSSSIPSKISYTEATNQYNNDNKWLERPQSKEYIRHFMNDTNLKITPSHDVSSYIRSRKPSDLEDVSPEAERILSSFLTFPLTLGYGLRQTFPSFFPSLTSTTSINSKKDENLPTKKKFFSFFKGKSLSNPYFFSSSFTNKNNLTKKELKVTVIGARAESALPLTWWKEMMVAFAPFVKISVHFLGPGLLPNPSFPRNNSKCSFFWSDFLTGREFQCEFENMLGSGRSLSKTSDENRYDILFFHQHKYVDEIVKKTDLFVLFNPGFGTKTLGPSWLPTLKVLLSSQKPVLSTSHCLQDHQSDIKKLTTDPSFSSPQFLISSSRNPYSSLRSNTYNNPDNEKELQIVTTNEYFCIFRGTEAHANLTNVQEPSQA